METYQIDILNPKATRLLQDLADLNLISIKKSEENDSFQSILERIRKKATANPVSLEDITEEVELIRAKRYEEKKR